MPSDRSRVKPALALLWQSAQPDKVQLYLGIFWLLIAAGSEMIGPILGKILIDAHILTRHLDYTRMALILVGLLLSGWLASLLRYLQLVRLSGLAMRSVCRLREKTFAHVLRLPMTFFDKSISGQLVSRITNDTEAVKKLYIQVLFVLLNSGIIFLIALLVMTCLDWRLMLLVSFIIPVVLALAWIYQSLSSPAVSKSRSLRSDINAQMAETMGGMAVLQAHNALVRFRELFRSTNRSHYLARVQLQKADAWLLRPALDLLNVIVLILVIFGFSRRQLSGIEVGLLYAFINYIGRIIDPLIQIATQFSQLQQSVVAAARLNVLLQEKSFKHLDNNITLTQGSISIRNLHFGYAPGTPVFRNFSMEIPSGTFVGISGKTGSGKTTLLSLLLQFYQPQQGRIEVDGIALNTLGETALRSQLGLVPQDPFLFAATVRENIAVGRNIPDDEIEFAAQAANAHSFICALEKGYETQLGEGGLRLSTGQKQLIAIARALVGQPKILFLDEATSHIDTETAQIIQSALQKLHGKVTLIAIAHRLSTIRHADTIVVLNHGAIAESGTHETLLQKADGIYRKLYMLEQIGE